MPPTDPLSAILSTYLLIALAEIGDKSQLVCMALAARHRRGPVLAGAAIAFALLNTLAVLFGAALAAWVPEWVVATAVALLFGAFGLHLLIRAGDDEGEETVEERPGHGVLLTTALLIFVAEFGDKTQIAVAGLAGGLPPLPVWLGATAALITLSALGVWLGNTLLRRIPTRQLHRASGGLFLLFAALAAGRALG